MAPASKTRQPPGELSYLESGFHWSLGLAFTISTYRILRAWTGPTDQTVGVSEVGRVGQL